MWGRDRILDGNARRAKEWAHVRARRATRVARGRRRRHGGDRPRSPHGFQRRCDGRHHHHFGPSVRRPAGAELADLLPLLPTFFVYVLSFSFVGIYWNNHHHLLSVSARIGPAVMWSNLHFLFWLAQMPFATAWPGQNLGLTGPTVLYGALAFITGGSYAILQAAIIRTNPHAAIAERIGRDYKALASLVL